MISEHRKKLINHLLDGGKVQWKDDISPEWGDTRGDLDELICEILNTSKKDHWRIKPETKKTWVWVAQWKHGVENTVTRLETFPWANEELFKSSGGVRWWKIEESLEEEEV